VNSFDIQKLLNALGCSGIKLGHNGWVHASCPLARWKHRGGHDKHPSFGVSVVDGGQSRYRCHGCGMKGDLTQLLMFIQAKGVNVSELAAFVQANNAPDLAGIKRRLEGLSYGMKSREVAGINTTLPVFGGNDGKPLELPVLPESHLDTMRDLPPELLDYFTGVGPDELGRERRHLSTDAVKAWELGWHPASRRIAIPIRDLKGRLVGVSGRYYDPGQSPKYMHSSGFRRDFYLYGEHMLPSHAKTGFIVEGFFDAIWLWMHGYPAVAVMGSSLSRFQIEKFLSFFTQAVIVPDGDDPGYEAADKEYAQLSPRCIVRIAKVPRGLDPDQLDPLALHDLLGPAEFGPMLTTVQPAASV